MRTSFLTMLLLCIALPPCTAGAAGPMASVEQLDLSRYAGHWHEIAHLPVSYQRRCVDDITAHYTLRSDGTIGVRNACRARDGGYIAVEGVARQVEGFPARFQVRFAPGWLGWLPLVWADYWVLALDEDYQWSLVGEPGRRYLWILAREPSMDAGTFAALRKRAEDMGYDLSDLVIAAPLRGDADAPGRPAGGEAPATP